MKKLLKRILNYFFGKKEVQTKDYGCQPISEDVHDYCEPPVQANEPEMTRANIIKPERFEGESFEHYSQRRKLVKQRTKERLKGTLVFNSQNVMLDKTGRAKGFQFKKGKTYTRTKSK